MFIKEIELNHFKCHTNHRYQFGNVNHFFGDNYTGKSSIGEAIIFCLFGVTKHGYKIYVKDYLQEGKTSMKVVMNILIDDEEYQITRTMNEKGTTKAWINNRLVKDKELHLFLGDFKLFIYSFFPDIFPEEDKKVARNFIINHLIVEKNAFDELEKEKRSNFNQQKKVDSSKTFLEGQKSLLKKQIESVPILQLEQPPVSSSVTVKKEKLLAELNKANNKLHHFLSEEIQLQTMLKSCNNNLEEIESKEPSNK